MLQRIFQYITAVCNTLQPYQHLSLTTSLILMLFCVVTFDAALYDCYNRRISTQQAAFTLLCFIRKFSAEQQQHNNNLQDTLVELVVSAYSFITNLTDIGDLIALLPPPQQAAVYYR